MTTTVDHGDISITCRDDAHLDREGQYRAYGVGDDGNSYIIDWSTTTAWDAANAEAKANRANGDYDSYPSLLDDESHACDWDNPSNIRLA